ncbi:hypothetical protein VTN00DRAFT_3419 [Thermoascus crustaceus]|uniref:uncharacterized protein n=1 Tax=Thermoascus crustaceus TaxID=5088 RepID=UPI00374328DB
MVRHVQRRRRPLWERSLTCPRLGRAVYGRETIEQGRGRGAEKRFCPGSREESYDEDLAQRSPADGVGLDGDAGGAVVYDCAIPSSSTTSAQVYAARAWLRGRSCATPVMPQQGNRAGQRSKTLAPVAFARCQRQKMSTVTVHAADAQGMESPERRYGALGTPWESRPLSGCGETRGRLPLQPRSSHPQLSPDCRFLAGSFLSLFLCCFLDLRALGPSRGTAARIFHGVLGQPYGAASSRGRYVAIIRSFYESLGFIFVDQMADAVLLVKGGGGAAFPGRMAQDEFGNYRESGARERL